MEIVKDIAQYEETDSELAKYTIANLQHRINRAISYIKATAEYYDETKLCYYDLNAYQCDELLNILKGSEE